MKSILKSIALSLAAGFICGAAQAEVPATSAYRTDTTYTNNQDASAEALKIIGIVSCYIRSMAPEKAYPLVGSEAYMALVDVNICEDDQNQSDSNGGVASSTNIATGMSVVELEGSTLIGKIWMISTGEDGNPEKTWVNARIEGGPKKYPPYGKWTVNWCDSYDETTKECGSLGHAKVEGNDVQAYFRGADASWADARAVRGTISSDLKSGGGRYQRTSEMINGSIRTVVQNTIGYYGFGPGLMYANVSALDSNLNPTQVEQCLIPDSSKPGALVSSWETWLYDSVTGEKLDTNTGFSLRDADSNWGWAGYWGVNIRGQAPSNGQTLTRVNSQGAAVGTYTAVVAAGKLKKVTVATSSLTDIAGLPLMGNFRARAFINNANEWDWINASFKWSSTQGKFLVDAIEYWDSDTGEWTREPVSTQLTIAELTCQPDNGTAPSSQCMNQNNIWSWQNGSSSRFNIQLGYYDGSNPPTASSVTVKALSETTVLPGDQTVPTTLACVGRCVDSSLTPQNEWQVPIGEVTEYTWSSSDYIMKSSGTPIDFTNGNDTYWSGVLVAPQDLDQLACGGRSGFVCEWEADNNLATYYRWESGSNSWNRFTGLKDANGEAVSFDPPLQVTYSVPSDDSNAGDYAGKSVSMGYGGEGNLWIPGYCFDPATRERQRCDTGTEWANEFNIPFDETKGVVTNQANGAKYLVKTLRRGVYFPEASSLDLCANLKSTSSTFSSTSLPSVSDWLNPADPDSPGYIGAWVNASGVPLVVNGVVQR